MLLVADFTFFLNPKRCVCVWIRVAERTFLDVNEQNDPGDVFVRKQATACGCVKVGLAAAELVLACSLSFCWNINPHVCGFCCLSSCNGCFFPVARS